MDIHPSQTLKKYLIEGDDIGKIIDTLKSKHYTTIGPTVRDGAIVLSEIDGVGDLPSGWKEEKEAGTYRLSKNGDDSLFGYTVGIHSWKRYLHPPGVVLYQTRRKGTGFVIQHDDGEPVKYAFIGVRPCELNAIKIQDNIFLHGETADEGYKLRRNGAFLMVVNCTKPAPTCFCVSMGTGPGVKTYGYDLALTEIGTNGSRRYVVEAATEIGDEILRSLSPKEANGDDIDEVETLLGKAAGEMTRSVDTAGIKELLYINHDHQQWDDVAKRCLTCGSCTQVCPTCFCNTVEDFTDIKGAEAQRRRRWDSCFTLDFTYIHGGSTRPSAKSRYRQWLTHKFAAWQDQYDTFGCVGCGRCLTWCPVGIDLTEELKQIQGVTPICKTCVVSRDKSFETMRRILSEHPFIQELGEEYIDLIAECSSIVRFNPGEFMFHAGEQADRFYLIRHGKVAIETFSPERGALIVQTTGEGDILGWSWFVPPYKWHFDAQVMELTRAIAVDAQTLRKACDSDPHLGYLINRYISQIIGQRMEATRMQLLDIYKDYA
jgi:sulfhydrogenase subunit beta (sulfur reductase)